MKYLHNLAGFLCAFCLMAILLITSVEAVAYWIPGYYEREYEKYQVLDDLPSMTMDDLLTVTDEMIAYLRGDREDLHVYTTMGGEYREFFNEREIAHMEDVRGLFLAAIQIRRAAVVLIALCLVFLVVTKAKLSQILPWAICVGMGGIFLIGAGLGALIASDFNRYFVIFHHIFFNNDLWILNPATDMLINIVPEPFFMDTAFLILAIFGISTAIIFGISFFLWRKVRKTAFTCREK